MTTTDNSTHKRRQTIAIRLSLVVGFLMFFGKWYAYVLTGSAAILSDAAESVVHVIAVAIAVYSVWLSHRPADAGHPYGHDKVAYVSAGFEGFLIIVAAGYIVYESVLRLLHGAELRNLDTGTLIILGASCVNLALGLLLVRTGRRTHSLILVADGKHVLTDSWTSFGIIVGLGLTMWTGWLALDPIIAILVAVNILWSGGKLIRESVGGLMDERDPAIETIVAQVLQAETSARGLRFHEVRHRRTGNAVWVEFHLLFPRTTLLEEAHRHATQIEETLTRALPLPARIVSHLETIDLHDTQHGEQLKH